MCDQGLTLRPNSFSACPGRPRPAYPLSSESQERQNQGCLARAASNSAYCPCFSKTCRIKLLSRLSMRLAVLSNSLLSTLRRSNTFTYSSAAQSCPSQDATSLLADTLPSTSRSPACIQARSRCILVDSDFQSSLFSLGLITTVRTSPPPLFTPKANSLNQARSLRSQARSTSSSRRASSPSRCEPASFCATRTRPSPRDQSQSPSPSPSLSSLLCSQKYSPRSWSISLKSYTSFSQQYSLLVTLVSLSRSSRLAFASPSPLPLPILDEDVRSKSYFSMS